MSAKPKTTDNFESLNPSPQSRGRRDYDGQDIFVEDDPALQPGKTPKADAATDPVSFSSSLKNDLKVEKLTYIHQMLGELRKLSVTLDEPMVAYLIEMALLEADTALNVGHFNMDLAKKKGFPGM